MDSKTIETIQEQVEYQKDFHDELESYEKMINLEWELPDKWAAKDWVRKEISTDAHDAIKTATNIYDTNKPIWEILPKGLADVDNAEELETMLEWWMSRANKAGETEPFRKALHNSCLQNYVILQVDYLPYWLPKDKSKWNKEQKAAMKSSSFCVTVHDKRNVYYEMGKYTLKWAACVTNITAQEAIDHWSAYENPTTEEGKKISAAIAKMQMQYDEDDDQRYIMVDYTSHDKRMVSVFPTVKENIDDFENYETETGSQIEIINTENKLSFINWVIVKGESTPMLYSMHRAHLWDNQNIFNTIVDSTVMRRAVFPILQHTSPTGKELDIDFTGDEAVVELTNGESAGVMMPPPIDGAMAQLSTSNSLKISQATGIQGLANIEIAGNVQYAAVQAVIKLHMTNLVPYIRTVEKAFAQLGDLAFMWLQQGDGYTEIGYRTQTKGDGKAKGMGITLTPDDFDPDELFIQCRLIAHTANDKMQEANYYATLKNAGAHISWKRSMEQLGEGNGDVLEAEWLEEETQTIALQMKVKELDSQLQMKMKEFDAQMQMMMQQQQMQQQQAQQEQMMAAQSQQVQQPQGQVQPSQQNPMIPGGQGMNAAMGGEPTATAMPGSNSPVGM